MRDSSDPSDPATESSATDSGLDEEHDQDAPDLSDIDPSDIPDDAIPLSDEDVERALENIFAHPDKYDIDTLFPIFISFAGINPTTEPPSEAAENADEPIIPRELVLERAKVYQTKGVASLHAIQLALEDGIKTADQAEDQGHTGPVGGLVSS